MLLEIVVLGGALGTVAGVLQLTVRRRPVHWTAEAAVREAMRGPEAGAVRAEYRESGIIPPVRRPHQIRNAVLF